MSDIPPLRRRIHALLEGWPEAGKAGRRLQFGLMVLIAANVIALILETVPSLGQFSSAFRTFEVISVSVFAVEYVLRLWTSVEEPRYQKTIVGRLSYAVSFLALIDLTSIFPAFLPHARFDLRAIRLFRFLRLMRLAKLGRYSDTIRSIGRIFHSKRGELGLSFGIIGILVVVASTLIYFAEHDAQPDRFSSIPAAMWWAVATLTTIGYGDIYPVTPLGKTLASGIALLGIGLFALPTAILGSGFVEELGRNKDSRVAACPNCGTDLTSKG